MTEDKTLMPLAALSLPSEELDVSSLGPSRILLVDDREENLIALSAVLEPLGHELTFARSGTEALKEVLAGDFAVILLDVKMPDMDGFEAATLIKQRERSRYIPIIFITAVDTDEQYAFRGYRTGAVDYLAKPINPEMLRGKVQVFVQLDQQRRLVQRQTEELRRAELREAQRRLQEIERENERRYFQELAARERELTQFKHTLDQTLDAVFLFEPDTLRISYVNQGAGRLLGYPIEELMQMTPFDLQLDGGETQREYFERIREQTTGNHYQLPPSSYETRLRHRSGRPIPVEVFTQYVAPENGPARFISIVRDITKRKRDEAELARHHQRDRKIAEALQQSIVRVPAEDMFPGMKIATHYEAAWDAADIGGDYLDVFALEERKVAFVVGDVSGKGLAAAARTAEAKYALRAFLREQADPARALTRLNNLFCETVRLDSPDEDFLPGAGQFICVAVAVIDTATGEGNCALAGAEPPLVVRRRKRDIESVSGTGLPLGISTDGTYSNNRISLDRGDLFFMLTDGITEARSGNQFFGYEGLEIAASDAANLGDVQKIADAVAESAREFAGGKLKDDVCLLLAERY